MKEGWEYRKLKECCKELFAGGDVPKPDVSKNKTYHFSVPIYTNGVENEGLYGYTSNARVNEPAVTISARGTIGAIFRRYTPFFPAIRLITAVPQKDLLSVDYLYYSLKTLTVGNSGTSIPQLTIPNIKNIYIPIPPLSEQQSIVDYLDSAFTKIDAMKTNAEKRLNEAKTLFQASLKEMLEPKEGWEYKELGKVCDIVGGGTPDTKNKEYWRGNIPWATVSDMNCDIIKSTGYYITEKGLNESSSRIIKKGEIIIATRVGLGKVCKLAVDTAINQDLKGVIPKDNSILRDFIFYYFKHKAKYIVDNGIGATVKGVKIKFIEGLSFAFPSLSEQQSIVATLDSLKSKVDRLQENYEKISQECDALKQSILRQVFDYNNYFS